MNQLEEARVQINAIDAQIRELFERRMDACGQVLAYKQAHGLAVFDGSREQEVLSRNAAALQNPQYEAYYRTFLQGMMDLSKSYQRQLLCQNTVGYQGIEGAFSHIAVGRLFGKTPSKAYQTFEEVFLGVEKGEVFAGVIPFENSYTGDVGEVLDLLMNHSCHIVDVYDLPVDLNLLALPGADISDLRQVYSHPQAIAQCQDFLRANGLEPVAYANTALAAKLVHDQQDPTLGAIASRETAQLYGLSILREHINTRADNTTRFIVIAKEPTGRGDRFSLLFSVKHTAGQLAGVLQVLGSQGFNLTSIKSRPVHGAPWEYYFYAEVEGDLYSPQAQALCQRMEPLCSQLKVLGAYRIRQGGESR